MKKILLLPALMITLFACNNASEEDFKNIAKDTCDCVNLVAKDLSPGMTAVIIEADGDQAKLQEGMMDLMLEDQATTMNDMNVLQGKAIKDMETCMTKLETKYDNVYTQLSEAEVLEKMMAELEKMSDCKSSTAIIKMGMTAQGK